jgi:uncharacterized membrane protein HdeD (DUF308 family)
MTMDAQDRRHPRWLWTLGSGLLTIAIAVVAFFLPDIHVVSSSVIVGGLLLVAGLAELAFGSKRGWDVVGTAAAWSGIITAAAGLLFVLKPSTAYFQVANAVTLWLLARGIFMLVMAWRTGEVRCGGWMALTGLADLTLGGILIAGLPVTALVVNMFGPTPEVVARFALILAVSFAIAGISQVAIALDQRGGGSRNGREGLIGGAATGN